MIYYFIFGILFIDVIVPLLENMTACIITRMEQYKAKCALKITKINNEIEDIQDPPPTRQVVGFHMPSPEEFEEEYDD